MIPAIKPTSHRVGFFYNLGQLDKPWTKQFVQLSKRLVRITQVNVGSMVARFCIHAAITKTPSQIGTGRASCGALSAARGLPDRAEHKHHARPDLSTPLFPMTSTALSRFLTARAKALPATALPIPKPSKEAPKITPAPTPSGFAKDEPRALPADTDLTTIWNSGHVIAERLVLGRKVVITYLNHKN